MQWPYFQACLPRWNGWGTLHCSLMMKFCFATQQTNCMPGQQSQTQHIAFCLPHWLNQRQVCIGLYAQLLRTCSELPNIVDCMSVADLQVAHNTKGCEIVLPESIYKDNTYQEFLDHWGTHFVKRIKRGGRWETYIQSFTQTLQEQTIKLLTDSSFSLILIFSRVQIR